MPKPVDEIYMYNSYYEGALVFGSLKEKLDTSIGSNKETYMLDIVNFFLTWIENKVTKN